MRICAEALFALNMAVDTGLLACSARLCGERLIWRRLLTAGALGGIYAVAALLPGLDFLQHGLVRLCAAWLIGLAAFGASARLFRLMALYFGCACGFAGVVFAMVQLTGTGLLELPGGSYYPVSAAALLAVGAVCLAVCRLLFSSCAQHTGRSYEELTLILGQQRVQLRALRDTGNTLKDPLTNEQVLVAGWQTAARLLPQVRLCEQDFFDAPELMRRLSLEAPGVRLRLIPYRAVGVSQGLLLAMRCEMEQNGQARRPALAAFSPTPVSSNGEFEALTGGAA